MYKTGLGLVASFAIAAAVQAADVPKLGVSVLKDLRLRSATTALLLPEETGAPTTTVPLRELIQGVFLRNGCPLPSKLQRQFEKDYPKGYIPADLDLLLFPNPTTDIRYVSVADTSAAGVMNRVTFERITGAPIKPTELTRSSSYSRTDPLAWILSGKSSVVYTMDCSGFMTAAIAASAGALGNDFKTKAETALKTNKTMLVAKAIVESPVYAALFPNGGMPKPRERLDILFSIAYEIDAARPDAPPEMSITTTRLSQMLWASNSGTTSMQGQAIVNGQLGGGIGVVNVEASSSVGGKISRALQFSSFETYIIGTEGDDQKGSRPYSYIKEQLKTLVANAGNSPTEDLNAGPVKDRYEATFVDLTEPICTLPWAAPEANGVSLGTANGRWDSVKGVCVMSFKPAGPKSSSVTLSVKPFAADLVLEIKFPIVGNP